MVITRPPTDTPCDSLQREVEKLNELEYVHGELLANVWYTDSILRINPVLH